MQFKYTIIDKRGVAFEGTADAGDGTYDSALAAARRVSGNRNSDIASLTLTAIETVYAVELTETERDVVLSLLPTSDNVTNRLMEARRKLRDATRRAS